MSSRTSPAPATPKLHNVSRGSLAALLTMSVLILSGSRRAASAAGTDDAPANSTLVCHETFDQPLDKKWHVNTGDWQVQEGALVAREKAADQHAAAARRVLETGNAVYELNFQLQEGAKAFHFGFDPKRGTLNKKGHLFSVIITPQSWKILKHVDKARPKDDPNETLATQKRTFATGQWYRLRVTTWGPYVTAKIDDGTALKASHPSFTVRKPTLVFRCAGAGVEVDDLRVWTQNGQ